MTEQKVRLQELIVPMPMESFLEDHWSTNTHFLSRANSDLLRKIKSINALGSVEELLSKHKREISVFGPNSFRSTVPASEGMDFLHRGYNLYIFNVEKTVPEAWQLLSEVGRDLGIAPWQIELEAFAGKSGGISSRHYDHDVNFQILLEGQKRWLLERNRHISNPLASYHPTQDQTGNRIGFREEAYAFHRVMPLGFDLEQVETLVAEPGMVLFLPRAYWHETNSLTDTWSLNIVVKGITWAAALGKCVQAHLQRDPRFRAYCDAVPYTERVLTRSETMRKGQLFHDLKTAALNALTTITREEVSLAWLRGQSYRWNPAAESREVVELNGIWFLRVPGVLAEPLELDEEVVPALKGLASLRHPFLWNHAEYLSGLAPIELCNLLAALADLDLVVEVPQEGL